jgi:hypothetical protein
VEISCRVFKPSCPRESPLYRLVEQHLEELLRVWPSQFLRPHGPLHPVVERVLREFLECGLAIPRLLRPLFQRRRELHGELARGGAEAVKELLRRASGEVDARPGIVVSIATAGDLLQTARGTRWRSGTPGS